MHQWKKKNTFSKNGARSFENPYGKNIIWALTSHKQKYSSLGLPTYHIFQTIGCTLVLEEENRKKDFEAKNVVKYLITSFKAEIL